MNLYEASNIVEDIRRRHSLRDSADVRIGSASAVVTKEQGGDPYLFTALINTANLDRDREVVLPGGCDAAEFERSGAVFFQHSYDDPVAVPVKLWTTERGIHSRARFLKRPDDYQGEWRPDFVRAFVAQMAAAGKSAGVSIGFIPMETRRATNEDRKRYGPDTEVIVTLWKLLEWSIAPVQSNAVAGVTMVGKSFNRKWVRL